MCLHYVILPLLSLLEIPLIVVGAWDFGLAISRAQEELHFSSSFLFEIQGRNFILPTLCDYWVVYLCSSYLIFLFLMLVDIHSFIWKCVCIICHWHDIGYMYHMRTWFLEMNMRYVSCFGKMHKTRAWPLSLEFEIILRRRYVLKWECESKRLMNWTTWELWELWNLARNA